MNERNRTSTPEQVAAAVVKRERVARDWSLARMADELNRQGASAHHTTVHKIEQGTRKMTLTELVAYSRAFDMRQPELVLPVEDEVRRALRMRFTAAVEALTAAMDELAGVGLDIDRHDLRDDDNGRQAYDDIAAFLSTLNDMVSGLEASVPEALKTNGRGE